MRSAELGGRVIRADRFVIRVVDFLHPNLGQALATIRSRFEAPQVRGKASGIAAGNAQEPAGGDIRVARTEKR